MSIKYELLRILSDGRFHSGQQLAEQLSVTRAAVWKAIKSLTVKFNLDVHSVPGRGYCLAKTFVLLDKNLIRNYMRHATPLLEFETHLSMVSTNQYLMQRATEAQPGPLVVFAEHQSGGRGRRGRTWVSPFSGNIYMSMLWKFRQVPLELMGLPLAIGVVVCRVLSQLGVNDLSLKWPNDVLCRGSKLCGILVEMHGESNGPYAVVIGLGLNVYMDDRVSDEIKQPWIALEEATTVEIDRNRLAAALTDQLLLTMRQFESDGLEAFLPEWRGLDAFMDKQVELILADQILKGKARGVDNQGALLLEQNGQTRRFYSGEISLRAGV